MLIKYFFRAEYRDGTVFQQNAEDVSQRDPARSAFQDVDQAAVRKFYLVRPDIEISVDLDTGRFDFPNWLPLTRSVDGGVTWTEGHDFGSSPVPLGEKRLIFFRQRRHMVNVDMEQVAETCRYCIGWQMTVNGRNYQEILGVF